MTAKFKLTSHDHTIELEGSEEFVERQIENIQALLTLSPAIIHREKSTPDELPSTTDSCSTIADSSIDISSQKPSPAHTSDLAVPESFGEWMYKFTDDMNDQETALMCALFVQAKSSTNDFKTSEINNCLKEHGIKIANPSTNIQRLASKKLTFQTRKVGKLIYMRVSRDGEAHLRSKLRCAE
ncbi:hypothetical protein [Stutzerimonas nitrititolerans]|uniref:hypothetical protein n=1 Tax=Stutzerimonas nitrititolerans TaxID=2482751 RepID=UPI0028A5B018|nr:hypothetical protein [Stutzerimonas nitrititolerans]